MVGCFDDHSKTFNLSDNELGFCTLEVMDKLGDRVCRIASTRTSSSGGDTKEEYGPEDL